MTNWYVVFAASDCRRNVLLRGKKSRTLFVALIPPTETDDGEYVTVQELMRSLS